MPSPTLDRQFDIVGAAADSDEASLLAQERRPDVAPVDVQMPGAVA